MQSCPECTPPSPPPSPWTVEAAQAALAEVAYRLLVVAGTLGTIHKGLPRPADLEDRQEGRLPYDRATDILGTIECTLEDNIRPAVESLQRSSRATDAELEQEYRQWLERQPR